MFLIKIAVRGKQEILGSDYRLSLSQSISRQWLSVVPIDSFFHGGVTLRGSARERYLFNRPGQVTWGLPLFCFLWIHGSILGLSCCIYHRICAVGVLWVLIAFLVVIPKYFRYSFSVGFLRSKSDTIPMGDWISVSEYNAFEEVDLSTYTVFAHFPKCPWRFAYSQLSHFRKQFQDRAWESIDISLQIFQCMSNLLQIFRI